jgi:hypothetical protein
MGALPGVVGLADYLQQHGRRTRRRLCPPATFWDAATDHLTSPDGLTHLADAARDRYRLRHAAHLYRAAADAGYTGALVRLAEMREEAGDQEGAERRYRAAVGAGITRALVRLAEMREEAGDQKQAERLARQAADAGDGFGPAGLVMRKYWRYGLEADGTAAGPWAWPEPCKGASGSR